MNAVAALVLVCASAPADRLPPGAVFEAPPALVEAARKHVEAYKDPMDRSPYERHDFPLFLGRRIEWADGSAVDVSCGLQATLHQLEMGRFVLKRATAAAVQPDFRGTDGKPMPKWRKLVFELEDEEIGFPATLTCGVEGTAVAKDRPVAGYEKTRISIGTLQTLLFDKLPLRVRSDGSLCR